MENGRDNDLTRTRSDMYRTQDLYRDTQTDIYRGYDTDYYASWQATEKAAGSEEEPEEKPVRKKKKRRKKHYFLRIVLFAALLAGIYAFMMSPVFSIAHIEIEGNTLRSDDEIIEMSGVAEGDNMFKQTERRVRKALSADQYIADVSVSRRLPDTYTITITERMPVIAISCEGKYVILDAEGYAVDEADSTMHATLVTGLKINDYKLGEKPEFDDSASFREVSTLIEAVNDSGMFFKKLELTGTTEVKGYVTDTLICSGDSSDIADRLEEIKAVLYDLDQKDIKRGVINVGSDKYISFSPITE